ncbi:uncharacterized protein LOC122501682 [Leptopilina heterotoma]|uniref:uncharacterized protein LOC122501682 n=1 Tax=Leptopilina heterotoma TaxID=63436 RepID=UPI001CA9D9B0|nr:uncharacterized protein LOC122501682 [Leptopilina heterotoma]
MVTFGLSPAPFLAIRCLYQLAEDEGDEFPLAREILKNHFYVDNVLTGGETISHTIQMRNELIEIMRRAGFNLRQWASNNEEIIRDIDKDDKCVDFEFDKEQTVKTLGITWDAKNDVIKYTVNPIESHLVKTKRNILSEIAKIFDPLGLLGPVILFAKQIMQEFWKLKLDWGELVPANIFTLWSRYCNQLPALKEVMFERRILISDFIKIELHGFSDSSERGYGACVYLRSFDENGKILVKLVYAKSRVAPLKTVSLPRLELCGAQLLVKITDEVKKDLKLEFDSITYWTDSTITINWIKTSPHLLKTFVANRVSEIQNYSLPEQWRHVSSKENPADALSRGQLPYDFLKNHLWFNGPNWLQTKEEFWPQSQFEQMNELPEIKENVCLLLSEIMPEFLLSFSCYSLLLKAVAYCLRFKYRKNTQLLDIDELNRAEKRIIKIIQTSSFANEIRLLSQSKELSKGSKIFPLNPFLDEEKILRVGGRLKHSDLPYAVQHPILLPKSHAITDLIIRICHLKNHHSGIQTTLYSMRQKYWVVDSRSVV